jgi:hypothetical protein
LEYAHQKVYSNGESILEKSKICRKRVVLKIEDFLQRCSLGPTAWSLVCKNSFLRENRLRFFEGIYHEDELFTAHAGCLAKDIIVLDYAGYNYFQSEVSITRNSNVAGLRKLTMDKFIVIAEINKLKKIPELSEIRVTNLDNRIGNLVFGLFRDALQFFPADLCKDTLSNLRNAGLYPLPQWSSDIRYRFYRRLTLFRFPDLIVRFVYRLFPTTNSIWEKMNVFRSRFKKILQRQNQIKETG